MMDTSPSHKAEKISRALELAILLEVSGYPKPGNVHRTADFTSTTYEQYLASAVAITPWFRKAAQLGIKVSEGIIHPKDIGIGQIIKQSTEYMLRSQRGGNTLLGAIIILVPLAAAGGMIKDKFSISKLRKKIKVVIESTTTRDALDTYDAIANANPGGLNESKTLDINDPKSKEKMLNQRVTLLDTFKIASSYDSIAYEWVHNYPITFDIGYPFLTNQLKITNDINIATVNTFLKILSEVPDTFISRKVGQTIAEKVSLEAAEVLEAGGLATSLGKKLLLKFDKKLRNPKNDLSPGTTADITEAILAVNNLNGYKP